MSWRYLAALGATLAIEAPIYSVLAHRVRRWRYSRGLGAGIAVNLVSHPLAFLVLMPALSPAIGYVAALACVEVVAVATEALLLWARTAKAGWSWWAMSYVANGMSLSVGLLVLR